MFRDFTDNDTSTDIGIVTSGVWQDGASSIETFYTSSTQYTNTGDYNIDVYIDKDMVNYLDYFKTKGKVEFHRLVWVTYHLQSCPGALGAAAASFARYPPSFRLFKLYYNSKSWIEFFISSSWS